MIVIQKCNLDFALSICFLVKQSFQRDSACGSVSQPESVCVFRTIAFRKSGLALRAALAVVGLFLEKRPLTHGTFKVSEPDMAA